MRTSALKYTILSWVSSLSMLILLVMPFHALITVWGASLLGHYTLLRLWKEIFLVFCLLGTLFLVSTDHKIRSHTLTRRLVWLIIVYAAVSFIWGGIAYARHDVSAKALGYGLIVNLRFLAFFLVTWAATLRMARLRVHWQWLALWPAAIVICIGLLQALVLPKDFLRHFGYGPDTILPYETINHNEHFVRIMSTLRGANPLGAYLLIPISLLTIIWLKVKRVWPYGILLAAAFVVLFLTFSRSAWIGALLSVGTVLLLSLRTRRAQQLALVAGGVFLLAALITALVFHNNTRFQNFVLHTQTNSAVKHSSNEGHASAFKQGVSDIWNHPLGGGTGTAGPASIYNNHCPARIAENYFIQIGQETGIIGLGLFLLINAGVGYLLWSRRSHPLALSLFASFIGLTLINLLSHAWTDDTLAYVWWGLAGIAMSPGLNKES
jgi:O-antigen ligase